jgi:hypothetical protein
MQFLGRWRQRRLPNPGVVQGGGLPHFMSGTRYGLQGLREESWCHTPDNRWRQGNAECSGAPLRMASLMAVLRSESMPMPRPPSRSGSMPAAGGYLTSRQGVLRSRCRSSSPLPSGFIGRNKGPSLSSPMPARAMKAETGRPASRRIRSLLSSVGGLRRLREGHGPDESRRRREVARQSAHPGTLPEPRELDAASFERRHVRG